MIEVDERTKKFLDNIIQQKSNEELYKVREAKPIERDIATEAIVSFAPALFGAMTGESGALAAPAAAKQSRDFYESGRKEAQDIATKNAELQQKAREKNAQRELDTAKYLQDQQYKKELLDQNKELKLEDQAIRRDQNKTNAELAKERFEATKAAREEKIRSGGHLELPEKKMVETLATKTANIIPIKNEIDSVTSSWDKMTDEQRLAIGNGLIKTLNSTQGADAVGVEEAKRLAGKLEYAYGNLTSSNPTQFGRDLPGFLSQIKDTADKVGGTIKRNQKEIDRLMKRPGAEKNTYNEKLEKAYAAGLITKEQYEASRGK